MTHTGSTPLTSGNLPGSEAMLRARGRHPEATNCPSLIPPTRLDVGTTYPMRHCAATPPHRKESRRGGGGATKGIVGERLLPFLWWQPSGRQVDPYLRFYPSRIALVFSHPALAALPPRSCFSPRAFSQDAGWRGREDAATREA